MATNNNSSPKPGGSASCSASNTPMHHLLAEGKNPKVSVPGPKTPA